MQRIPEGVDEVIHIAKQMMRTRQEVEDISIDVVEAQRNAVFEREDHKFIPEEVQLVRMREAKIRKLKREYRALIDSVLGM